MSQFHRALCMKVSTALAFLLLLQSVKAQYNFSELDSRLQQNQSQLGKDVAALVYKDGKIIYQKSLGAFNPNTQALIASCSKWLTAALVMTYVDEGKISLDDKVSKYLPIFETYGKSYITIRQCMSHLTGIQGDKPGLMGILKMMKYKTLEDEVNDFASKNDIQANPGTEFRYSSIGLNIAGRILEVISKKPFERLMQDRIFKPLNMKNSSFASEKAVNPSGGAKSTANDYMNFLVMILNKGVFNGKRILSEQAVAEMEKTQTRLSMIKYAPKPAEGFNYALGEWVLEADADGNGIVVSSPGLFGTWPVVDNCRGYASIIFVKTLLTDEKKDIYIELKQTIDKQIPTACTK